jgi:RNA polymerase-binding transcription factor DksA
MKHKQKYNGMSKIDLREVRTELEREHHRFGEHDVRRERYARALDRLAEGRYGICEACGDAISPARLLAIPETPHCVACSARAAPLRARQFATLNGD